MTNMTMPIEGIPPIDRVSPRLAEWAQMVGQNLVEPLGLPYETWVGETRVASTEKADRPLNREGQKDQERQGSGMSPRYVQFVIDQETQQVSLRVIDRESGRVVRTIPPEDLMRLLQERTATPGALLQALL